MTFADDIDEAAGDEPIEAVVIAPFNEYGKREEHEPANALAGRVLTWPEARAALDYEFDSGFGGQDCHNVAVYTATRVISVHEYDGSTGLIYVPRNPTQEVVGGWCGYDL